MNLPNVLTLLRILAVPAIVALVLIGGAGARWLALILYALAAVSTGGFAPHDASLAAVPPWARWIVLASCLACSVSLVFYHR